MICVWSCCIPTAFSFVQDNHIVPELHCKVIKWMRNHAYISSFQRTLKVPVKSVPPRRRTKSNFRIVNDEKLSFSKEKINDDGIIMAGVENGLLDGEDSIGPGLESVLDGTKKVFVLLDFMFVFVMELLDKSKLALFRFSHCVSLTTMDLLMVVFQRLSYFRIMVEMVNLQMAIFNNNLLLSYLLIS